MKIKLNNRTIKKILFESTPDGFSDDVKKELSKWGYDDAGRLKKDKSKDMGMSSIGMTYDKESGLSYPQPLYGSEDYPYYDEQTGKSLILAPESRMEEDRYGHKAGTEYPLQDYETNLRQAFGLYRKFADWSYILKYVDNIETVWSWYVSTMATDGGSIAMNPSFFKHLLELSNGKYLAAMFVYCHEAYHMILRHTYRTAIDGIPFDVLSNIAADYDVHCNMVSQLGAKSFIPSKIEAWDGDYITNVIHGCWDEKYTNKSFEQIYKELTTAQDGQDTADQLKDALQNQDIEITDEMREAIEAGVKKAEAEIKAGLHG